MANLCIVHGKEAVGQVLYLLESLALSAYFKQVFLVYEKISSGRHIDRVACVELVEEERLTHIPFVCPRRQVIRLKSKTIFFSMVDNGKTKLFEGVMNDSEGVFQSSSAVIYFETKGLDGEAEE